MEKSKTCEIIRTKDVFGGPLVVLKAGLVRGRNDLAKQGFSRGANPIYMRKENEYWHYNRCLGYWIYEKAR